MIVSFRQNQISFLIAARAPTRHALASEVLSVLTSEQAAAMAIPVCCVVGSATGGSALPVPVEEIQTVLTPRRAVRRVWVAAILPRRLVRSMSRLAAGHLSGDTPT